MKYDLSMDLVGRYLCHLIRKDPEDRPAAKKIRQEYREILLRASDIGSRNRLLSSYLLAAFFIAMNRCTGRTPEENIDLLQNSMAHDRMLKLFMGDSKHYFSEKNMESRRVWARMTQDPAHQAQYPNDWVVSVVEKNGDFQFGFDYHKCGVCNLCREEGCPGLAKYLCRLDDMLVGLMGLGLERTETLAEGGCRCDFRFLKNQ